MNFREYVGKILRIAPRDVSFEKSKADFESREFSYGFVLIDEVSGTVLYPLKREYALEEKILDDDERLTYEVFSDFAVEVVDDYPYEERVLEEARRRLPARRDGARLVDAKEELDSFRREGNPHELHFLVRRPDEELEGLWATTVDYIEDDDLIVGMITESSSVDARLVKGELVTLSFDKNALCLHGLAEMVIEKNREAIEVACRNLKKLDREFTRAVDAAYVAYADVFTKFNQLLTLFGLPYKKVRYICGMLLDGQAALMLMKILSNNLEFTEEDIVTQACVISRHGEYVEDETIWIELSDEERKVVKKVYLPFDLEGGITEEERYFAMLTLETYWISDKCSRKESRILDVLINDKLRDKVFVEEGDAELVVLDEQMSVQKRSRLSEKSISENVGRKAQVKFQDGKSTVGYVTQVTKDADGDECISLFESYDVSRGFGEIHFYKFYEVVLVRTVACELPLWETDINFDFE